jgi:ABC-2 type transport system ATP-binding protein
LRDTKPYMAIDNLSCERIIMNAIVSIRNLTKTYANGFQALKGVNLDIIEGEILALLGPNGAGKTTLISIICGLVNPGDGQVLVAGHDVVREFRKTRELIGLVPQELTTDQFETVWNTVSFSRGLHGKKSNPELIESILKSLSLWEKRNNMLRELSGGMKRRVLIAKALAHEPKVLFLDEPTAGVDVALRRDMWRVVEKLRANGVTIILTTHYIEEAEEIADRVGVINGGELLLVEEKTALMRKLGRKQLSLELTTPITVIPDSLGSFNLLLSADGSCLTYEYDGNGEQGRIAGLLSMLSAENIQFRDISTRQSSLEDIFVALLEDAK